MTDVSSDLPREISDRGKDASREQVPLDLGEPQFDLIQPRRIGRREVQPDIGVRDQERAHGLRLMRREVIDDHVDLAARGLSGDDLAEELDERRAGVARHGLREHFTGPRVEGRKQRQRACR